MAYDANQHNKFSQRCENWIQNLRAAYDEAGKIDDIYTNETVSGTDPAFVDTPIATKAEHTEAINVMRRLRDMLALDGQTAAIASQDQTANLTPFLQ